MRRLWSCLRCGRAFRRIGAGSVVYCSDACMVAYLSERAPKLECAPDA